MDSIKRSDLKVGETYFVDLSDCCIAGTYIGKLIKIFYKDDEELWEFDFDNLTLNTAYSHSVNFYPASPEEE